MKLRTLLMALSTLAILLAVAVRVYAAYNTVPIRTWDDAGYRTMALEDAAVTPPSRLLSVLLLPKDQTLRGIRTRGYHSWLVTAYGVSRTRIFQSLFGSIDAEYVWQTVNILFFVAQGVLVTVFAYWALGDCALALATTAVYLVTPIVFGINRWVMTESHSLTALWLFGWIPAWYVTRPVQSRLTWGRCAALSTAALIIAVFSSVREYAVPSLFLSVAGLVLCLARRNRPAETFLFLTPLIPYFIGLACYLPTSFSHIADVSEEKPFFHPLSEWLLHAALYSVGPGVIIFSLLLITTIAWDQRAQWRTWLGKLTASPRAIIARLVECSDLSMLLAVQVVLFLLYLAIGVLASSHRTMRPSAVLMVTGLVCVMLVARMYRDSLKRYNRALHCAMCAVLFTSVSLWWYQLLIPFEGGKEYFHTAHGMEYFNHPLQLWPLKGPADMHIHPPQR